VALSAALSAASRDERAEPATVLGGMVGARRAAWDRPSPTRRELAPAAIADVERELVAAWSGRGDALLVPQRFRSPRGAVELLRELRERLAFPGPPLGV